MKLHKGIWFPDGEVHMIQWCDKNGEMVNGKTTYQLKKLLAAIPHCKNWRTAVDVGSHIGFWSMHLSAHFAQLHAFEPVADFRACWTRNMEGLGGLLYPCALGAAPGKVQVKVDPTDTGGSHVIGEGDIEMRTLDSFDFQDVDFLKVDCEGLELAVVQGAADMLERCRPVVIVEQKQHIMARNFGTTGTPAVDFLLAMGAKQRTVISGDYILSFD